MKVTNVQELEALIQKVKAAQVTFATFSQEQVDQVFKKAALAANADRIPLAKLAVAETGMGIVEDKVIKNHFASEEVYNKYRHEKTCGVIEEDRSFGIQKVAEPVGILAGIIPTTNPTSTVIFKALITLKTRNAIIFSPHPRAKHCTIAAAKIILDAAVAAGAPEHIIGWIDEPTVELSQALMQHPDVKLILATGGPGMVKAAYSSGRPSLGVGAGNTPAVIDETAHIPMAVSSILLSKTFDNGMICASEQSVVVGDAVYDRVKQEFSDRGAYFLSPEERQKVANVILKQGRLNADIVGQSALAIAELAGVDLSDRNRSTPVKVLIGEVTAIDETEPFAYEKLSPVLAMYRATDFTDATRKAQQLIEFGGRGHTSVLYTGATNYDRIAQFKGVLETARVLINTPSSQGAIGDLYNFKLDPSLTLGCGTWGGNSISGNVGPQNLLNIKTVTERRENMQWFRIPPKIYFKYGALPIALRDLIGKKRAFIITDKPLYELGMVDKLTTILDELEIRHDVFYDVEPDPKLSTVHRGLELINNYEPDVIIAIGGGSPMDAAKVMWLMYEHPEIEFEGLAMRFMDIRKRVYDLPPLGQKAILVAIPTTSGTGSEVTPFAVVTDEDSGVKYPLADYALTPNIAIVDPELVLGMPQQLVAYGGVDALTHALEAYVSVLATDFTNGLALEAIRLLVKYLPLSYQDANNLKAREKVHYAATIAGLAFANAFLGICHSMAHQLGAVFHIPHGLANALMISHVIRYNATDAPYKQAIFPQYKYPNVKDRYARIADHLNLGGNSVDEKVDRLIAAIEHLKRQVEIPPTIQACLGGQETLFYSKLEQLADQAFDDQCTGANPRYPLIQDLKEMFIQAYYGHATEATPAQPRELTTTK